MVGSIGVRKGAWTEEEDMLLRKCIEIYGEGKWHLVPSRAGLNRCRKSCRLRWLNYLRPNIKRGVFAEDEVDLMIRLHKLLGNRWSLIAARLPGRTSNDVKNYWNSHVKKKIISKKKKVGCEITSTVKHVLVRPRARSFSRSSTWSRVKSTTVTENVQLKDGFELNPSTAFQLQALESNNTNWSWESLLDDKSINGGSTCSALELEDDPLTDLWIEEIEPATPLALGNNSTIEEGKDHWSDIPLEADDVWNILSAI